MKLLRIITRRLENPSVGSPLSRPFKNIYQGLHFKLECGFMHMRSPWICFLHIQGHPANTQGPPHEFF